jgi:organic radical activating enzyme
MLNDRCPLRCAHCSVGYSSTHRGSPAIMDARRIEAIIGSLDPSVYNLVILAGGEPTLSPALVTAAIDACKRVGVPSMISTGPFWASTIQAAHRFLDKIPPPSLMSLSLDKYHLDFLKISHYRNAALVCMVRGIRVVLNVSYESDQDLQETLDRAADLHQYVSCIGKHRVMPKGNARFLPDLLSGCEPIETADDLDKLPRSCSIGSVVVNQDYTTHMCCWSGDLAVSPLKLEGHAPESVHAMEETAIFHRMYGKGLIDGLSETAKADVAAAVAGGRFVNECHLCVTLIERGLLETALAQRGSGGTEAAHARLPLRVLTPQTCRSTT